MKRVTICLFALAMACGMLAGCGEQAASSGLPESVSSQSAESPSDSVSEESSESEISPAEESNTLSPVYASQIADGTYAIEVSSSSSMFRIVDAQLTVAGREMTAVLTLSGTGYEKLYMGTGEEALVGSDDTCIYFVEGAEGQYTYEVPVAALERETDVAAWSIRKQTWYDRVLVFQSSSLPGDAITQ